MSWFGQIAGGLAEGAGKGGAEEALYREKLDVQRELTRERAEERRLLQDDRQANQREMMLMRAEMGGGKGKGGGGSSLFDAAQTADTPQKQERLVETVRAFQGDEAANVVSRLFGRAGPTRMANPATESVDGYVDPIGGAETAVPSAVPVARNLSASEAEKGRVGLQRLLALVEGKSKDQADGEGQNMVNDMVRGARTDRDLRAAGAVSMATKGSDRFAVADGTSFDKAGVTPPVATGTKDPKAVALTPGSQLVGPDGRVIATNPKDKIEKALPTKLERDLGEQASVADSTERFVTTFKDDFAGKTIVGEGSNTARRVFGDESGQAQWWQDYTLHESVIRNKLFGASLTPGEQGQWLKLTVTPRMDAEQVRLNIQRRAEIEKRGLDRMMNSAGKAGYNREQIEAVTGRSFGQVSDGKNPPSKTAPDVSAIEAEMRRRGLGK